MCLFVRKRFNVIPSYKITCKFQALITRRSYKVSYSFVDLKMLRNKQLL